MNNNILIEKLIKLNNDVCPEFTYTNPLLDKSVAKALSRSLVKVLKVSTQNSNVNNNLRVSVLENIRKLCKVHPDNHLKIDDNITELLTDSYEKRIQESVENDIDVDKKLDKFFIRNYKEIDINSSSTCLFNPEIFQALMNLNATAFFNTLSKTVIQWNVEDARYLLLAQELWNSGNFIEKGVCNDLSIKLKSKIEMLLLEISSSVLDKPENNNYENMLSDFPQFKNVTKISSSSCDCFQMCCSIFNFILIVSKFAPQIQNLIEGFIKDIKLQCMDNTISVLYPLHLMPTVVLLDIDISHLPTMLKDTYIQSTLKYLKTLQSGSETDLILLLSHFPDWFDIYFR